MTVMKKPTVGSVIQVVSLVQHQEVEVHMMNSQMKKEPHVIGDPVVNVVQQNFLSFN